MRLRALAVTTALALAATGLTACTSKIGQAAVVGTDRISTKTVDTFVNPAGPTAAATAQQQGTPTPPRVFVLETLIQRDLFRAALAATPGGVPSDEQLRAVHDQVASQVTQGQVVGADFDKAYTSQLVALGYRASLAPVLIEVGELEYVLAKNGNVTTLPQLLALIGRAHRSVSVSPRYGSWDASQLTLSTDTKSGRPSFLTIGSDTQTSASSTGQ